MGRDRGRWITAVGLGLILVGGFLPWLRSGRAWRTSYEVVRTADRLGLVADDVRGVLAAAWYLVPLLCGLTLVATVFERPWLSLLGAGVVAALAVVMAVVALRAPLVAGRGPEVALCGAVLAVAGSVVTAVGRHDRRPIRRRHEKSAVAVTHPTGPRRRSGR